MKYSNRLQLNQDLLSPQMQKTRKAYAQFVLLFLMIIVVSLLTTSCKPIELEEGSSPNIELTLGVDERNLAVKPRRSPLAIGSPVPTLWLLDQTGREVSTREVVLGGDALLLFSPGDSSPEARALYQWVAKNKNKLGGKLEILIVTPDPVVVNAEIAQRENLGVALLSDPANYGARTFGVLPSRGQTALEHTWSALLAKENTILGIKEGLYEQTDVITQLKVRPQGDDGGVLKMISN